MVSDADRNLFWLERQVYCWRNCLSVSEIVDAHVKRYEAVKVPFWFKIHALFHKY